MNNAKFKLPKYSQVAIYLHKHLEHYHRVCQMPNIWHLTHQTPIFKLHKMFQNSNFFIICLFTISLSYIHSDSLSLFSHLEFILYACHFFSLVEAADLAEVTISPKLLISLPISLQLPISWLPLHSHSFPLSSSSHWSWSCLKPPRLELPILPGAVSPRATNVSSLHLTDLPLSLSLFLFVLVAMFIIVVGWFWLMLVGWFWLVVIGL